LVAKYALAQQAINNSATAISNDQTALRTLITNYFDFCEKKDSKAMGDMWSAHSSIIASRHKIWRQTFTIESYRFTQPQIIGIRVSGDTASLQLATERRTISGNDSLIRKIEMRVEYLFVKEDGGWKFLDETPTIVGLYADLVAAESDAERRSLLDRFSSLVTQDLLFELSGNVNAVSIAAELDQARRILAAALAVAERINDRSELADIWEKVGNARALKQKYREALDTYQKALMLNQEVGSQSHFARTLTRIGLVHSALNQPRVALDYFQRGLTIYEQLNESQSVAQTIDNIGDVHYKQGDIELALEFYRKSLMKLEASRDSKLTKPLVTQLLKVALTEREIGNDTSAVNLYQRAIAKMDNLKEGEARSHTLLSIGEIYYAQGNYPLALDYYLKSLKSSKDSGDPASEALALQGLGNIHSINGNYELALSAYQRNLSIAQLFGEKTEIAAALTKVGSSHSRLDNLPQALEAFQKALAVREELKNVYDIAAAKFDVADTFAAQNEFARSIEQYDESRKLYESAGSLSGVAAALLNVSRVHFVQQQFADALKLAEQAAAIAKRSAAQDLFWQARYRAGRVHYKLHNLMAARQALTEAIRTIETMSAPKDGGLQSSSDENKVAPYLAMVDVLVAEGRGAAAFNFAERAKARSLASLVRNSRLQIDKTMTQSERERELRLTADLASLTARITSEKQKQQPNQARIESLSGKLKAAQAEYDAARAKLFALRPQLKVMRGEASPLNSDQALKLVPDAKTALLSFVQTEERTYLFVLTRNQRSALTQRRKPYELRSAPELLVYALDVDRPSLYPRILNLKRLIATVDAKVESQARELYDLILKPVQAQLDGRDKLIIAPDGVFWNLPFQALRTPDDRYLIETHAISLVPSLTAFNAISELNETQLRQEQPLSLLAFGAPSLNPETTERIKMMLSTERLKPLNRTQAEVEMLGKLYGSGRSATYTGADASKERMKAEAGKYGLLHVAARGMLSEAAPFFSAIALSTANESTEDGILNLQEIIEMDLKSSLIVLSASEEVAPQLGLGRDLTGVTWALGIAGCPTSLVARWQIDSPSTTELMSDFYRALKSQSGNQKSQAWQSAVNQLLRRGEFSHPYYWAGFEMLGDAR